MRSVKYLFTHIEEETCVNPVGFLLVKHIMNLSICEVCPNN